MTGFARAGTFRGRAGSAEYANSHRARQRREARATGGSSGTFQVGKNTYPSVSREGSRLDTIRLMLFTLRREHAAGRALVHRRKNQSRLVAAARGASAGAITKRVALLHGLARSRRDPRPLSLRIRRCDGSDASSSRPAAGCCTGRGNRYRLRPAARCGQPAPSLRERLRIESTRRRRERSCVGHQAPARVDHELHEMSGGRQQCVQCG